MKEQNIIIGIIALVLLFSLLGGLFGGMMGYGSYGMMGGIWPFGMMWFGGIFTVLAAIALILIILWLIKQLQEPPAEKPGKRKK